MNNCPDCKLNKLKSGQTCCNDCMKEIKSAKRCKGCFKDIFGGQDDYCKFCMSCWGLSCNKCFKPLKTPNSDCLFCPKKCKGCR